MRLPFTSPVQGPCYIPGYSSSFDTRRRTITNYFAPVSWFRLGGNRPGHRALVLLRTNGCPFECTRVLTIIAVAD
jgi:hypothetical protein